MLCLHLLQACLVYVNTLLIQEVLSSPDWYSRMTQEDWRGLTPLFYTSVTPYGNFHLDMTTCPFCQQGSLRLMAAITHESVMTRNLRHLKLASVPPPIAPARYRQEIFVFD